MRINKFALLLGLAITLALFFEVAAHADEVDQSTKITFSAPIQIPGKVLPAGTYLFKLAVLPAASDRDLVQILTSDGSRLIATLQTIPTERSDATDKTVVILADRADGIPDALVKWYFPAQTMGHEFVYSQHEEQQIAQSRQQTIEAKEAAEAGD
jgi:hypothetical protein